MVNTPPAEGNFALELVQGGRVMPLRAGAPGGALSREVVADFPFASGDMSMRLRASVPPVTATELLVILTPVLMWLWASLVGWIIVQRLLLRPLGRIQNVISAYKPGDRGLDLPTVRSPALEIAALGQAFDQVTQTVARHEAELESAVARQTRLVREVHHRVKNNLQVVASLLNLHSRGSANEEVAAAYASIQRRVDALAVVHRNHYAELEANRGVALKPLLSELGANLRATAPASAAAMQIRLDIAPVYATQDAAVSVAFLVTEIVEFGMLCGADMVSVVLEAGGPGPGAPVGRGRRPGRDRGLRPGARRPVRPDRHRPRPPAALGARARSRARPLFGRGRHRRRRNLTAAASPAAKKIFRFVEPRARPVVFGTG